MISASEAKEITAKSNSAVEHHLKRFDLKIRAAAEAGKESVDLEVGESGILPIIMQRMNTEHGYGVEQLHSQGFRVNWRKH